MTRTRPLAQAPVPSSADPRWVAVSSRDRAADGSFVYAVRSTGIFCRPSCPSRRPRPERVLFFDTVEGARGAGFRPCRRCRPDASSDPLASKVRQAAMVLDGAEGATPSLASLARAVGCSPSHLQRAFVRVLGVSPREYGSAKRAERLRAGLRAGQPILDATYDAGFGSPSRVYEGSSRALGMTPAQYRRRGAGLRIGWATARSALGVVLVASTSRGIAAVMLGDSEPALESTLRAEFPAADIMPAADGVSQELQAVVRALEGDTRGLQTLPLDVQATAFQRRVWRALQEIPAGATETYAALARRIGRPSAARAVARACATNPVAVVVPCHRVVPASGGTGGYRWGAERKSALLALERKATRRA